MRWYEFNQNNSGGSFDVDNKVCHRVLIEAENEHDANDKACELGIYFDGCMSGRDCNCCGDRWSMADDYDVVKLPQDWTSWKDDKKKNIKTIEEYAQICADEWGWTIPDARLYYADGKVKEIFKEV